MPEISIIVPVYKSEKYIARCVESILCQSFKDFELILVDDGTPDKSGEICDRFALKDDRIKAIHKTNGGVSSARNVGLSVATGNFIMFCDSDDYVAPEFCQKMLDLMKLTDVDLGLCAYYNIDNKTGNVLGKQHFYSDHSNKLMKTELWNIYMNNMLNMPWNKIYRRRIIQENNILFDETIQYNEDLLFVMDYIKHTNSEFGICNIPLYYYIQGITGSLTRSFVPDLWNIKKRVFKNLDELLAQCGISIENIVDEYYTKWLWSISCSVASELDEKNNISLLQKYKNIYTIMHDSMSKKALKYGKFEKGTPGMYALLYKTGCVILIMLYTYLGKLKNKQ